MDQIMEYLEREAFGGYTWMQVGIAVVALVAFLKLWAWIRKPRYTDPNLVPARCSCGWRGKVGKFNPTCPRCSSRVVF